MPSPVKWMTDEQYEEATLPERALAWADSQVGKREDPPGSNQGPEVDEYLRAAGVTPGLPWCASGVYWCLLQAGADPVDLPAKGQSAAVWRWRNWAWDKGHNRVMPGRGLLFYWFRKKQKSGHMGFCLSSRLVLGRIHIYRTIEFNSNALGSREGDRVVKRTRVLLTSNDEREYGFIDLSSLKVKQ